MSPRSPRSRSLRPHRRRRSVALTLAASLAFGVVAMAAPSPASADAFYDRPANTSTSAPGSVLRSRAAKFSTDLFGAAPDGSVKSWQVMYRSTNATGQAVAVSGTVLVPASPWNGPGKRPLITYSVGTRGLGDACAPSKTLTNGTDYEALIIKGLLMQGWAVAVSDYEGLGTAGQHTYVVGQSEGRAVLDMARAAQRLPEAGLSTSSPVGIMGYSQGGGGAGWAAQLAATYAPELAIKGTVAGGVPGDLTEVAKFHEGSPVLGLTLMAAVGLDAAYPELNLENYLNDRGRQTLAKAESLCLLSLDGIGTLISASFQSRMNYVTTDPLATPAWKARLAENKLGSIKPSAPVFQFHGTADQMVPFKPAADLRRAWCNKGANVTWATFPAEHVTGLIQAVVPSIAWLHTRFLGLPALSNCWMP